MTAWTAVNRLRLDPSKVIESRSEQESASSRRRRRRGRYNKFNYKHNNKSTNQLVNYPSGKFEQTTSWLNGFCDSTTMIVLLLFQLVVICCCCSATAPMRLIPIDYNNNNRHIVIKRQIDQVQDANATSYSIHSYRAQPNNGEFGAQTMIINNQTTDILHSLLSSGNNQTSPNHATPINTINSVLGSNMSDLSELASINSTEGDFEISSETERYILMVNWVAEIAVFIVGSIGNGIVIAIILFFTKGNSVADIYIFNLAIADITFCAGLSFIPVTSINEQWVFGNLVCKMFMSLTALNQFASSLLLSLMSFDRYLAVCHPIFSQRYRNPKSAKLTCLVLWILCFVLMIPIFIHAKTDEKDQTCGVFWPEASIQERVFTLYSFCLGFLLPLMLIVVFYRCVVIKLKSTASGAMSMQSERRTRQRESTNKRVSNLVKAIVATYGICWLPYWIGQMLIGFSESKEYTFRKYYTFNQVAALLSYLNSAVNPILYAFLSDSFRRRCSQFWRLILSFQLFKRWQSNNTHGSHQPHPVTQTSMAENHNHHHHHHHHQQQHHHQDTLDHCENNNISTQCNDGENNIGMRQNHQTRLAASGPDLDPSEDGTISSRQHSMGPEAGRYNSPSRPNIKPADENNDDEINTNTNLLITINDGNAEQHTVPSFRKPPATITTVLSFGRLKFKRRKKKHSLVKLNHMSCAVNGAGPIRQTVLLPT